jgi:cystathionine beta-lyase family protein involved in aluminum resistance
VKARSLKTLSHLTFLISMIVLLWSLADDLTQVATQKTAGIGAVAGSLAETLRTFSSGIFVSAALLCAAVICERLIRRRMLGTIGAQSGPGQQ